MSKLLSLDVLTDVAPQQLTMVWTIDAATGRPRAFWVAEPRIPAVLASTEADLGREVLKK